MPSVNKRPRHAEGALLVCLESFASSEPEGGCAQGTRLRGNHPKVNRWPQYFAPADTPDDELERLRRDLYPNGERIIR
jgi:hypothetical protein